MARPAPQSPPVPAAAPTGPVGPHTAAAPARAELWWVLADVLSYPTEELTRSLRSGSLSERVSAAARALPYELPVDDGLGAGDPGGAAEPGTEFLRLFEVPGPSGRPCPLRVGAQGGNRRSAMEELLRFYRHFGLTTAGSALSDLPDAVPTVAEFLAFLATSEAGAPARNRSALRAAQRDLLHRHVVPAAAAIAEGVGRLRPSPFYRAATGLLAAYSAAEAAALAA